MLFAAVPASDSGYFSAYLVSSCFVLCPAAGDLWLLSADDNSTLLDAVMESFRIHDRAVSTSAVGEHVFFIFARFLPLLSSVYAP